ncbi:hypothetical protein CONLIGDRAFT_566432 [Coniochaeta ligniaria NRRL 30616]|uniref:BZIP domain-containing protein n=1 Tax=Coniochaeta ligniaria NRRL 30616 TaxID=1408157 RepID=A0A1J7J662_9PEZI|nr:hypothetical protein CONLIGDRAFT_566432 [Coniochaeta ligniaria NRRL 30616]
MVSAFQMQQFYTAPLTVDTNHAQKYFEEEDSGILDEDILESGVDSGLEMSPPMADSRRDSYAVSTGLFSPKTEDWQSVDMQSVPSNNPFLDQHSNNPFMRLDQHQQTATYGAQGHWGSISTSGTATPIQTFDGLPAEFDSTSIFQRPPTMAAPTPFGNTGTQMNMFQSLGHPSNGSIPPSPQKDQSMPKRNRPGSPMFRSHNELRRGDGIRKKNARFDIPAERNLSNIDHLIAQSTDEQEIKELKQQKRLLRNRQAALDSRQRKKQHTERLEDEKKQYTEVINQMEQEMDDLKVQMEQLLREKDHYTQYIESLNLEKEEMIRSHTIETGELRKKISVLTNHVQSLEGPAMTTGPTVPNHASFPTAFGEMDGLTMDGTWDNMPLFGDFSMDQQSDVKQETMQIVPTKKPEVTLPTDVEKSSQPGGILFMLFLVGAFVLSNRATAPIRVSEDVREASATLLENVFKDAGVAQSSSAMDARALRPSGTNWAQAPAPSMSIPSSAMDGVTPSMLGDLTDSLAQPTQEQTNEQIFSMSAAQYNGVASHDFLQNPPVGKPDSQGRRNLAEALANMRNNKNGAAEVYTRSLLWDQIPSDVVRSFAKMVAERNTLNQQNNDRDT